MTSADKILRKALVGSGLDTKGWNRVQAGLRDRALFSSQVQDMKFLHGVRENAAAIAAGTKSMSEARRDLRLLLGEIGYDAGENRGTIKDLLTKRRLDVMLKTNVAQAKGYASHLRATTGGALEAFPGYELVRVQERSMPRDWTTRWNAAAAKVGWSGVARGGRKVALKTSPIWVALSAFGNPFPPFDFNSGMGVEDVDRATCAELGLIDDADETPAKADGNDTSAQPSLNDNLFAPVPFEGNTPEYQHLKDVFGDQITHEGGTVRWRGEIMKDVASGKAKSVDVGKTFAGRLKISHGDIAMSGLDDGDVDLIPSLMRRPDRITKSEDGETTGELDTLAGYSLVMHVKNEKIVGLGKRKLREDEEKDDDA